MNISSGQRLNKLYSISATFILSLFPLLALARLAPGTVDPKSIRYRPIELNSCEAVRKRSINDQRNNAYEKVFPYYVEVCAGSTWQKRGASDGGNYGHAFLIIRGACMVRDSQGQPTMPRQLQVCKDGVVGVSTDYAFSNVQWLATEGRDLFLYGGHAPYLSLNSRTWREIQDRLISQGVMKDIKYKMGPDHEVAKRAAEAGQSIEDYTLDWATDMSMGTDFAIAASRGGMACTRIPLVGSNKKYEDQPLRDLVRYLNQLNQEAYKKGFDYDGLVNSCSGTVHNSLAILGFWGKTNTQGHPSNVIDVIARLNDMPSPFMDTYDSYKIGSQIDVDWNVNRLRKDPSAFAYFKKTGWLFKQFGTMLDEIYPLEYRNEIYNTENNTNFATMPYFIYSKFTLLPKHIPIVQHFIPDIKITTPLFQAILHDNGNPAVNLVRNYKIWNEQYAMAMSKLDHYPRQDEVTRELRKYYQSKFRETLYLYGREKELTANLDKINCR